VLGSICSIWLMYLWVAAFQNRIDAFDQSIPERWLPCTALVGLAGACLLIAGTQRRRPADATLSRILGWRPLAWLGSFSYSIYLMHYPLLQLVYVYIAKPLATDHMGIFLIELAAVPGVIFLCWLFHLAFERPFRTRRRTNAQASTLLSRPLI